MLVELLKNQIALAMFVFIVIVIGALWKLDISTAKEVLVQIITAVCALVTSQLMDKSRRASDKVEQIDDAAKIEVAKVEAAQVIQAAKTDKLDVKG